MSRTVGILSSRRGVDATRQLPTGAPRPSFARTHWFATRRRRRAAFGGWRGDRQLDDETRTATRSAVHDRGPAVQLRQLADHREADPAALIRGALLSSQPHVWTPNTFAVGDRNAWALILDRDARA